FFSSRRRHTRFSRDWSSDVCSSDLGNLEDFGLEAKRLADSFEVASIAAKRLGVPHSSQAINAMKFYALVGAHSSAVRMGQEVVRSEERRVGKEGWFAGRGWAEQREY